MSGSTSDLTNSRPLSILPELSIVLERFHFDYVFRSDRSSISNQHHGFVQSRCTVSRMLSYLDHIYSLRDNNVQVVAIQFGVKKAFDYVKSNLLLSKLVK